MSRLTRTGWELSPTPPMMLALSPEIKTYHKACDDGGYLTVFAGPEPNGWHLSISHKVGSRPGRYPTWDEIVQARYEFCPALVTMAQLLPPRSEWVNAMETTFHLWEIPS